mgnify:CR=1 FL=1
MIRRRNSWCSSARHINPSSPSTACLPRRQPGGWWQNLPVALFLSKNQGGHQQVDARIAYNEIDLVIMFSDPNDTDPWEDQRIMRTLRLCDMHNVPCATNLASAEMLILGLQRGDLDWRMMIKSKKLH